jgi:hypothetical protein
MFKLIVMFMSMIVELLVKWRTRVRGWFWVAVGILSILDWRIVDSCADLPWTVMARPLVSLPSDKKVNLVAPSILPELMIAEKVPVGVEMKLAEAKSLPGSGGLTKT